MKRRYFFPLAVAFFIFLYIGPVNFTPSYTPSAIPTENNVLSDFEVGEKVHTEFGYKTYLGSNQWSYFTEMGIANTWDGEKWVRWIYNQTAKSVTIGNVTLTHLEGGVVKMTTESGLEIGRLKWYSQYYAGDQWNNVSLPNYQWLGFEVNETHGIANQRFWGATGELVVSYIYRNNEEFKITVNVTNNAAQSVPVRIVWVAHDLKNVAGEYELIIDEINGKNQTVGIMIEGLRLLWMDALHADPNIAINTIVDKPNRRAAVVFGNQSSILPAGHTYTLDPSVNPVLGADGDDDWWRLDETGPTWYHNTASTTVRLREYLNTYYYMGQFRFALAIESGATIDSADLTLYEYEDSGDQDADIWRIDEANVGDLESDGTAPICDYSDSGTWDFDGVTSEWNTDNVTNLVQDQIDLGGWASGQYIGFMLNITTTGAGTHFQFEDYQGAGTNHAYMNVTYTVGGGNNAPVNDQTPTLDNADDTDNMYAQYREYQLTVYVSDADGYADIDYLEVSLWDNGQSTEYFRFRYDEDTDTFTEEYDSGSVVSLNTGSSSATEAGNDIDATFYFTIDWDHADLTDIDTECYVVDDEPESDTDFYESNFDVETRLDYSVAPSVTGDDAGTVDRGDFDESFTIGGTLIYYGSTDDNPASNQIDVWVSASEYGSNVGPWSDTTLTAGAFSVTCYADNVLGQDTYTIKPVLEGAGSGASSQYYDTDLTDTYIADIVQVQSYSVSDSRVNINDNVNVDVTLYYDYDDSQVTDGTVTINGESAAHQGSGVWRITVSESTVTANTYDTVAVTGNTHGLTTEDQNGQSTVVIWDRLVVTLSADSYAVVNGTQVNITISIVYDYDDAAFTYYNLSMTRDAVFWYVFNHANSSLCNDTAADIEYTYTVNALNNETTYGITSFISNSIDIEWSSTPPTTTTPTGTVTTNTESIFFHLFLSLQMWGYLGPLGLITIGYIVTSKEKNLGFLFFIVESIVIVTYLNLAATTPAYWWHAYIMLFGCMSTLMYSLWDRR